MNTLALRTALAPPFLLGVATSAFQIEGAVDADGRGRSIWDDFCHTPGKIRDGSNANRACDHYHWMEGDVALLHWLGVDAYRFSIAWPRVMPRGTGLVNAKGLDFYDRLVDALLEKGIRPCATLYHWDLPSALPGGWLSRDTAAAFADYAVTCGRRLGDRVALWMTHNEPWCQAFLGYEQGVFAPGQTDIRRALLAAHHLLLSAGLATSALRADVSAPIGIALNFMPAHPYSDDPDDLAAARRQDAYFNRWFLEPVTRGTYPADLAAFFGARMPAIPDGDMALIGTKIDFMGVNYYERCMVRASKNGVLQRDLVTPPGPRTADREIYPEGLYDVLERLHREYGIARLIVTENGAAFDDVPDAEGFVDDAGRTAFLRAHLEQIVRALAMGIPVNAFFAWSLLDNFEWNEGYRLRYGIVRTEYETGRRIPKASARFLRSLRRD